MRGLGLMLSAAQMIARPIAAAIVATLKTTVVAVFLVAQYTWRFTLSVVQRLFIRGQRREIRGGSDPVVRRMTITRFLARLVDILLLFALFGIVFAVVPEPNYRWAFELAVIVGYFSGSLYLTNTTVGKYTFGLQVVSTVGNRLSFPQLLLREVTALGSVLVLPIAIYVVMKNRNGEQIGDVVADTRVLELEESGVGVVRAYFRELFGRETADPASATAGDDDRETAIQTASGHGGRETALQSDSTSDQSETTLQQSDRDSPQDTAGDSDDIGGTNVYNESGGSGAAAVENEDQVCPQCKAMFEKGGNYCPDCGAEVSRV